jgi:Protein of unknown function (DUF1553)/Protein of unknown function (DUF1549)
MPPTREQKQSAGSGQQAVKAELLRCLLPAACCLLSFAAPAGATPANKNALADFLGPFLPATGVDCRTCHVAKTPTAEEHEHNSFGARLVEVRKDLRRAGKPADLRARLEAVAEEDSDGDGASNLVELLTGRRPGDASDTPTAAERQDADARRAAFRKHLAAYRWRPFEPVVRPPVPAVGEPHPVDAFLTAARRELDLTARPEAPKPVLLRRLYLDLIGLPPSRADADAFLADPAPDAYEKVVDRLLASPQYGERWGRHWMDVWRYSDWAGYGAEVRESLPHIWQWRDWIVESLNADKGYDRMVREMLAGDEMAPLDPATLRATGFLARNSYKFNRNVVLDNTVEHTAKAFLGLTLNCARCHDHMYDPVSQKEYYSFRALFEPCLARTDRVPGHADTKTLGLPRIYDATPDAKTYLFVRGNEATPDKEAVCPPAVPAALGGPPLDIKPIPLPREAARPDSRPFVIAETRAATRQGMQTAQANVRTAHINGARAVVAMLGPELAPPLVGAVTVPTVTRALDLARLEVPMWQARFAALEAVLAAEAFEEAGTLNTPDGQRAAEVAVVAQRQRALAEARHSLLAAELAAESATGKAKAPAVAKVPPARAALAKAEADAAAPLHANFTRRTGAVYPDTSTGRRLALAKWVTDRQNPLAARVAVNHVWARHFGRPLVPTVFDFGRNGQPPRHPALLDWLAAEFMDRGWSMKHLHRLLVTSRAYRMDSHADPAPAARDPDNVYCWRMPPRRMEAEVVRDSVLALAGRLDRHMGGPELDQAAGLTTFRRSVYYRHANEKQVPFLIIFDAASANECYQRPASIVPQQALALANSPLTREASRAVAERLSAEVGLDDAAFIAAAFRHVLTRPPTGDEARECATFLSGRDAEKSRASLVHVLFNHHDFVTVH